LKKPEFGEMTFFNIEIQKKQANAPNSGKLQKSACIFRADGLF
jgi:hypothetical protein